MERPETSGSIDRWAIFLVFLAHFLLVPWFPSIHSANELSRLFLVDAVVDRGDVEITEEFRRHGGVNDRSQVADSLFSDKPPGAAFLAVPFVAARRALGGTPDLEADLRLARLAAGVLPTLLLLLLLRRELRHLGIGPPTRALVLATYGLGTLAFTYSVLFFAHQLTAVLLFATYTLVRRGPIGPGRAAGVGALAAACLAVEYQSAVYLLPLAVAFLVRTRLRPVPLAMAAMAAAPILAGLGLYHDACFGSPLRTGYSFIANPFFASVHAKGFMGIAAPRWAAFAGSFLTPSKGLLFFSPFLALGFLGVPAWRRAAGAGAGDTALRVAMIALPVAFVSSMVYWDGGWTVGQRHLTPLVPFLLAPAAALIERRTAARLAAPTLAVMSVGATGAATWAFPYLPESVANPLHDIAFPLLARGWSAAVRTEPAVSSLAVGGFVAGLFLVGVVGVVSLWPDRFARKVAMVVVLCLVPLAWYDGTSRIARQDEAARGRGLAYYQQVFREAGRVPRVTPPTEGLLRRPHR